MDRSFCIAPMMARTDKHFRYLVRQLTKKAVLFTEMIHTNSILFGNKNKLDDYSETENPIVLQLGGNDPEYLSKVCKMAEHYNYNEINLNLGCPSPKVKSGNFGAALMEQPEVVKDCLVAMQENSTKAISVKIRLGVNDNDINKGLDDFVTQLSSTGITVFYVHARKAILDKLSPKDNREIPPLNYSRVRKLKKDFPDLQIIINGGITDYFNQKKDFSELDGIMIGREAYSFPRKLEKIDSNFYGIKDISNSLSDITNNMFDYFETLEKENDVKKGLIHMHGLYSGLKNAKKIRVLLSNSCYFRPAKDEIIDLISDNFKNVA
jgi:tRNA-dihydrouridine synthase A